MADTDAAVVRRMLEAFIRGDLDRALGALDPDVEWDGTNLPDGGVARGREASMEHVTRWAAMWETWEVELQDVVDKGRGRVVAFIRERGRSQAGIEVDERHSELYLVREGKVVYRKGFSDPEEALREIDLR